MSQPAAVPPGLRVYAIGDIHGCASLLDKLHDMIRQDIADGRPAKALVIYVGDYVDRGPDSKGVLDRLNKIDLGDASYVFLKGNHEVMLETFLKAPDDGAVWCNNGGYEALLSYGIDVNATRRAGGYGGLAAEFAQRLPATHDQFLSELEFSFGAGDYFFCHAGIRPRVPLDQQDPHDLMWIRHEFISSNDDHGKIIVHGHTAREQPEVLPNRINIDTGAYATGCLTALVLEGSERRFLQAR